jgi:chromosome segregation ATPase
MTQETSDILAALSHHMAQLERRADAAEQRVSSLQSQTYAEWRAARGAELLLVRNDLEETRRVNRKLLEDQHNLLGRLHDVERECAAALQEAADWRALAERRRDELSGILEDALQVSADLRACRNAGTGLVAEWRKRGRELDELRAADTRLVNQMQQLEFERDQADAYAADVEATNRRLTAELTTLRTLARAVCDSAARELNYSADVLLVSTAALRQLEKAVRDETTR